MPTAAYFFAKIAMSLCFGLIIVLLLSAVAIGLGGVRMTLSTWLLLLAALLLGTLPFSALGLWIGTLVKGAGAVAVVNLIYLPMSVLSGLWFPIFMFPSVLQKLALLWPSWHLAQLALGVVGQVENVAWVTHVAALLLMTTLFLALAALRLRKG
jgi:ABC-2 type transport system permease protein